MFKPSGVIPALVTPFNKHQEIDFDGLREVVNYALDAGVTGVVPCGTTGEFSTMTFDERVDVIKKVIEEVNGRVPVIAGTGCTSTHLTIKLSKKAKDLGCDAILVVAPYFLTSHDKGLYEHYSTLASKIDIPIIVYNIPQCSVTKISWPLVEDLAEIDNIVGIKDSSGDMRSVMSLIEKVGRKISVLIGFDEIVFPSLASGAAGCILASANIIPDIWLKIYKAVKENNYGAARELQFKVQKLTRIIVKSGAVGVKESFKMMGIGAGVTRKPNIMGDSLTFEDREELRIELEKLGKVKVEPKDVTPEKLDKYPGIKIAPEDFKIMKIGEALVGSYPELAHIDVLIGGKNGPLGQAFCTAKATPTPGHEPLLAILEPNVKIKPETLVIPTVKVRNMRQASLIYGSVQKAVATAVIMSVEEGFIPQTLLDDLIIIANAFVHPSARNRHRLYINNLKAMRHAIRRACEGRPTFEEILQNKENARHPLKYTP
jgi:4-hydroxy-tetrahydrodipicolinate synthase